MTVLLDTEKEVAISNAQRHNRQNSTVEYLVSFEPMGSSSAQSSLTTARFRPHIYPESMGSKDKLSIWRENPVLSMLLVQPQRTWGFNKNKNKKIRNNNVGVW